MPRRAFGLLFAFRMILAWTLSLAQAPGDIRSDAEIRKILADRIGEREAGIVLVAGVIDAKGRRVVGYGSLAGDDRLSAQRRHHFRNWVYNPKYSLPPC